MCFRMAPTKTKTLAALLALPLAQCSHTGPTSSGERMQAALSDARSETAHHAEACARAESLAPVMSEVDRHEVAMGEIIERMNEARAGMRNGTGMMHCTGKNFDHMSQTVESLDGELTQHLSRLRATEKVDDAHSECTSHAGTMDDMMRDMMGDLESMPCMGH